MKEKVKVETATNTGKKWNDKTIIQVKLDDGRTGASYDEKIIEYVGKEVELDIKEGKQFNGVQQYYFNIPKAESQANGSFPKKDWSFEKRKTALMAASASMEEAEGVIRRANVYLAFLNQ